MNNTLDLEQARAAYADYVDMAVKPLVKLSAGEVDELGFADMARRIGDPDVREHYRILAIRLLDANIADIRPAATNRVVPEMDNTGIVVWTLIAAAIGSYFGGVAAGLLVAAFWYGAATSVAKDKTRKFEIEVNAHNELVAEWAETMETWERARSELQGALRGASGRVMTDNQAQQEIEHFDGLPPLTSDAVAKLHAGDKLLLLLKTYTDEGTPLFYHVEYVHRELTYRSPNQKDAVAFGTARQDPSEDFKEARILFSRPNATATLRGLIFFEGRVKEEMLHEPPKP